VRAIKRILFVSFFATKLFVQFFLTDYVHKRA